MADQHYTVSTPASEWGWSLGDGCLRLNKHQGANGEPYWMGDFLDPRGMVSVYRQSDLTRLDFVHQGRCLSRSWERYFGDRTVGRLARAFVSDVLA